MACAGFSLAGAEKNIRWGRIKIRLGRIKIRWGRIKPEGLDIFFCPPPAEFNSAPPQAEFNSAPGAEQA